MKIGTAFAALALLALIAHSASAPTIRKIDGISNAQEGFELTVFCDAPRNNLVYMGHMLGPSGQGIAVVYRPDACK